MLRKKVKFRPGNLEYFAVGQWRIQGFLEGAASQKWRLSTQRGAKIWRLVRSQLATVKQLHYI